MLLVDFCVDRCVILFTVTLKTFERFLVFGRFSAEKSCTLANF